MNQVEELKAALLATQELNDQFLKQKNQAIEALALERRKRNEAASGLTQATADMHALNSLYQDIENALGNIRDPETGISEYHLGNISSACYNIGQITAKYV